MSAHIHPTAIVEDGAEIADDVQVGPFSYVRSGARLGTGVVLKDRVTIYGTTHLREGVSVHTGSILGDSPQVRGIKPEDVGTLEVGPNAVIREKVTVHAGWKPGGGETRIGANCFMMADSHAAHDCIVGDDTVFANNVAVAGHCIIGEHVWLGGSAAVHQFTHIGRQAIIGGGAAVVGDVIPFGSVIGNHARLAGLNLIGMKRRGLARGTIHALRAAHKAIFHGEGEFNDRVDAAAERFADTPEVMEVIAFIRAKRRRPLCRAE